MSKMVKLDDDVYEAVLDRKHRMMSMSDVVAQMLAELDIEPFASYLDDDEEDDEE